MRKKTSRPTDSQKTAPASGRGVGVAARGGVVIAVELGAEFPSLSLAEGAPRRVVTQQEGETPTAFAERAASALEGALGRGVALCQLALACNERLDESAQHGRRQLASVALGAMAKHHAGKVSLCAPARSSGRLRQGLSTLARGLFDEWRTAGLEATVDFGDVAPVASDAVFIHTARVA